MNNFLQQAPCIFNTLLVFAFLVLIPGLYGCGPDKELLKETKFSSALRQRVTVLEQADTVAQIPIKVTCSAKIDGIMYQGIVGAGGENVIMDGDRFTADVSSDDVFEVANLEFVVQLELGQKKKGKK